MTSVPEQGSPSLYVPYVLVFASAAKLNAFSRKVLLGLVGENNAAFTVRNEFPHGAMQTDPKLVD